GRLDGRRDVAFLHGSGNPVARVRGRTTHAQRSKPTIISVRMAGIGPDGAAIVPDAAPRAPGCGRQTFVGYVTWRPAMLASLAAFAVFSAAASGRETEVNEATVQVLFPRPHRDIAHRVDDLPAGPFPGLDRAARPEHPAALHRQLLRAGDGAVAGRAEHRRGRLPPVERPYRAAALHPGAAVQQHPRRQEHL